MVGHSFCRTTGRTIAAPRKGAVVIDGPECVKTRQNVVGAQRLLSVVGYLAPKSFWLSYGGPD
ncbi:hypothetical protein CVE35_12170 [Pseudomonas syringae pv. actinidiae]|nr:hypothetical protein [Pseudomonas syringae pv. actinidiae]NAS72011.1 hypothetical protein [Pseudomonas syringae pv. actinidiae]NAT31659.1 hypothetical protein [Pseudomonas syringae pv. actinidiae]NAT49148.1 hypothetical protein [Pseudomonas syringae pv. actinidiae]NAT54414.1 hypothetical protein [Pseudomonas syringae pv. actinidiae]